MANLAAEIEQTIRAHCLMPVNAAWANEIVFPYYEGLSIRNLVHTAIRLLDGKPPTGWFGSSPLDGRLWQRYWGDAKRIVLFISDGLGWKLLNEIIEMDRITAQAVADLTGDGSFTPITSVAPSTTAAALPSIWTGAGPSATGMVGTTMFLREYGVLADMLHYYPVSGRHRPEVFEDWGMNFEEFVPVPAFGVELSQREIPTYILLQKALYGSGLSRIMHHGVANPILHIDYTDLWITLRDLLHKTKGDRCFINVYWGAVDAMSHLYGTASEQSINEIRRQLTDLRDTLLLEGIDDGRTLLMFTADHGHTPVQDTINAMEYPPLAEALRCLPGGEWRFGHWYLRYDYRQQVIDYLQAEFGDQVTTLLPSEALQAGLFGSDAPCPETAARLGDLSVIARANFSIGDRPIYSTAAVSRHGGLSEREMLVPLLMRLL
jgi:hypothetical protein